MWTFHQLKNVSYFGAIHKTRSSAEGPRPCRVCRLFWNTMKNTVQQFISWPLNCILGFWIQKHANHENTTFKNTLSTWLLRPASESPKFVSDKLRTLLWNDCLNWGFLKYMWSLVAAAGCTQWWNCTILKSSGYFSSCKNICQLSYKEWEGLIKTTHKAIKQRDKM